MRLAPEPTIDALYIGRHLQREYGSFAQSHIHYLTYLSCLLWLYRRYAFADWGYEFVGTELGAPFSVSVDLAMKELNERGYLIQESDRYLLPDTALQLLEDIETSETYSDRINCLTAACSSTIAFPIGMVTTALDQEPELQRTLLFPSSRILLEESARERLFEDFTLISNTLSSSSDLRVPAIVWLTALYRSAQPVGTE
jgi:hypothetical protein